MKLLFFKTLYEALDNIAFSIASVLTGYVSYLLYPGGSNEWYTWLGFAAVFIVSVITGARFLHAVITPVKNSMGDWVRAMERELTRK
jgi:hypothetical protein